MNDAFVKVALDEEMDPIENVDWQTVGMCVVSESLRMDVPPFFRIREPVVQVKSIVAGVPEAKIDDAVGSESDC